MMEKIGECFDVRQLAAALGFLLFGFGPLHVNVMAQSSNFSDVYYVNDNMSGPAPLLLDRRKWLGIHHRLVLVANDFGKSQMYPKDGMTTQNYSGISNISQILDNLLWDYDSRVRPGHGGPPTVITTSFMITSIGPISEFEMTYQLDSYFRQSWQDERLKFDNAVEFLSLNVKMLDRIWKPDTYFHNGQHAVIHTLTQPNKLLRIFKDGTVLFSTRLTITAKCPMQLHSFPMDRQSCPLIFGSYAFTDDQVTYEWAPKDTIELSRGLRLSQFDLVGSPRRNLTVKMRRGTFSILQLNFDLKRHTGYFVIQVYVPCILIVVLSWVSFWINREATSDRVGLGITTVLTLSTFGVDANNELPKVHYATALHWFIVICFCFVIASVLEFAGVHYFTKVGSGETPLTDNKDTSVDGNDEWEDIETQSSYGDYIDKLGTFEIFNVAIEKEEAHRTMQSPGGRHSVESKSRLAGAAEEESPVSIPNRDSPRAQLNRACCAQFIYCILGNDTYRMRVRQSTEGVNSVSKIDKVSRFLFPITFGILNLCYWVRYTQADSRSNAD